MTTTDTMSTPPPDDDLADYITTLMATATIIAVMFFCAYCMSGCEPGMNQRLLNAQADVWVDTQEARFAFYDELDAVCRREPDLAAYEGCMLPAEAIARSADTYRHSLTAAQRLVSLGDSPAADQAMLAAACAALHLVDGLEASGVEVPDGVRGMATLARGVACE